MADQLPGAPAPAVPNPAGDLQAKRKQFLQGRRDDVSRQANAGLQQNNDAINRRFAAIGGSGSGAQIAANLKAQDQASQQARQGAAAVDAQEMQMLEGDATRGQQESQYARTLASQQDQYGRTLANQQDQFGKTFGEGQRQFDVTQGLTERQFEEKQLQDYMQNMQAASSMGVPLDLGGMIGQVYGYDSAMARRLKDSNQGYQTALLRSRGMQA